MYYKTLHILIFTCTVLCFVRFTELSFKGSFIYNLCQNWKGRVWQTHCSVEVLVRLEYQNQK